jgi:hypothetical protein
MHKLRMVLTNIYKLRVPCTLTSVHKNIIHFRHQGHPGHMFAKVNRPAFYKQKRLYLNLSSV